ncbi:MAG: DUF4091 domain-containing protein [Armatimonadetes bacterium]|nr:DUF4091 domain-containing protein [Armatimonadota bacterium]
MTGTHIASIAAFMLLLTGAAGTDGLSSERPGKKEQSMQVFVADSLTKVFREPEDGERPLAEGPIQIHAARHERESFQVVVMAGEEPLKGVEVHISDLTKEDGSFSIPPARVRINPVGYVETQRPVYEVERVGWWPDPLLPPAPVEVEAEQRQPFWVTVHVPESAPAGHYRGAVRVTAEHATVDVPVELTVWGFTLAPTPPLPSAIAIYPHALARFYGEDTVPEKTLHSYWDMLFTHRLSSDDLGDPISPGIGAVIDGRATGPFDYSDFDARLKYCFAHGLTAFQSARLPGFQDEGPDLTVEEQERLVAYLGDLARHFEQSGWLERAFAFVWDEPRERRAREVLTELQVIHRAHPGLRARLDGPVTGPLVEMCENEVDIWGMHLRALAEGGPEAAANVARWREKGNGIWMYVACDTHHPYPNIFIDYPLIDCRVLPWVYWHYDVECFLYWSANWFGEENMRGAEPTEKWPQRPWVSGNFVENWGGKHNVYNGDGQLIYPGSDGTALSSIRLEALRDGLEDYEYLWLLRKGVRLLEAAEIEPQLCAEGKSWLEEQEVVTSFTEWCQDPEELRRTRDELGAMVERVYEAALH